MVAYSFRSRFRVPIKLGLGLSYPIDWINDEKGVKLSALNRPKRQTIRAVGKRRHARTGETVQLYYGMRTKHCIALGEGRCTKADQINIDVAPRGLAIAVDGRVLIPLQLTSFAQSDGFENEVDMHRFWLAEHGVGFYKMMLIQWEPFGAIT